MSSGKRQGSLLTLKIKYIRELGFNDELPIVLAQAPDCLVRKRPKRDTKSNENTFDDGHPATIEVYSGLYVNENAEIVEDTDDSVFAEKVTISRKYISQK